jgi:hypothetical protein
MGRLGRERTFIVCDPSTVELPTDLLGLSVAKFDSKRGDGNLRSALLTAATEILHVIRQRPKLTRPTAHGRPQTALWDTDALYSAVVSLRASDEHEIIVQAVDTAWAWRLVPTLVYWRSTGVAVRVVASTLPVRQGVATRAESARRLLLANLGVEVRETDTPRVSGFFLRTSYPEDNVAIVLNDRSGRGVPLAVQYEGGTHASAVDALLRAIPYSDEPIRTVEDYVPRLIAADSEEIFKLLRRGVKQYRSDKVRFETSSFATAELMVMSSYVRGYKSKQIERLVELYKASGREPFTAAAVELRSGATSIVTPPVVEVTPQGPVVLEGTTRVAYCARNKIAKYHCIAVYGVEDPLPGTPVEVQSVATSERSLSQTERTEDFQEPLYRQIERATHPY